MTIVSLVATDQLLSISLKPEVASGDINSVKLHVDFDSKWDKYTKSAVFFTSDDNTVYEIMLSNGDCVIPHETLANPGTMYIGVRGVNADNNAVKTSSLVKYKISEGAPSGDGTTVEPTADVYQQLLTAYKKAEDAIAVERERIDKLEEEQGESPSGSNIPQEFADAFALIVEEDICGVPIVDNMSEVGDNYKFLHVLRTDEEEDKGNLYVRVPSIGTVEDMLGQDGNGMLFVQPNEPETAADGSLWVDTDEEPLPSDTSDFVTESDMKQYFQDALNALGFAEGAEY